MFISAASNQMNQFTSKERDAETGLDFFSPEEAWSQNLTPRFMREVRKISFDRFELIVIVGEWEKSFGV